MRFCEPRLARFKVPRFVRIVDELPDDGVGQDSEVQAARSARGRALGGRPTEAAQCFSIFDGVSQVLPSFFETLPVTVALTSCVQASPAFSATSFFVM